MTSQLEPLYHSQTSLHNWISSYPLWFSSGFCIPFFFFFCLHFDSRLLSRCLHLLVMAASQIRLWGKLSLGFNPNTLVYKFLIKITQHNIAAKVTHCLLNWNLFCINIQSICIQAQKPTIKSIWCSSSIYLPLSKQILLEHPTKFSCRKISMYTLKKNHASFPAKQFRKLTFPSWLRLCIEFLSLSCHHSSVLNAFMPTRVTRSGADSRARLLAKDN